MAQISRRQFIKYLALGVSAAALNKFLAACGRETVTAVPTKKLFLFVCLKNAIRVIRIKGLKIRTTIESKIAFKIIESMLEI